MTYNDYGHWRNDTGVSFNPDDYFGFVYHVTNLTNGKQYIGKKQFTFTIKKPPLKGKKNKRHVKTDSKWRTYTTSSEHVNAAIAECGMDKFLFRIISLHGSKGALHYAEVEALVKSDALIARDYRGDRTYYNGQIPAVKFIPKMN